ncbi:MULTISPECIES: hypothetical protein [unclassified Methylococcus]|uniref:hypothetical protein n=1 Tax=unclassified Methylococcus TaxID=2618889 RepID=UPI003D7E9885
MKPVIVVAAFRREKALARLLNSIQSASYSFPVKLIISLDGGASPEVVRTATEFDFRHGTVEVVRRTENIGLRRHIIWCGDKAEEYGSAIVLEDDLYVDPYFYDYAVNALQFYRNETMVAGIALYAQKFNECAGLPFEPIYNGSSGYFMQVACSWGQAWTGDQWARFKDWYLNADENSVNNVGALPQYVKEWPESSWKKYFFAYIVEHNKYIYYPYITYSTNCSDPGGSHVKDGSDVYQVPLGMACRPLEEFKFFPFDGGLAYYDSYMEPINDEIFRGLGLDRRDLEVDLYGTKPLELLKKKKYALTSRDCKRYIRVFGAQFRPMEKNLLFDLDEHDVSRIGDGKYIYLTRSDDVVGAGNPYFKLARYYSYIPFASRRFAKGCFLLMAREVSAKISRAIIFFIRRLKVYVCG